MQTGTRIPVERTESRSRSTGSTGLEPPARSRSTTRASGDWFELRGREPQFALDVFEHPYAYAAFTGVEYRTGERIAVYA